MEMKKSSHALHSMLVFALIGLAIASYDSYAIYNGLLLWCPPPIDGCNTVAYSPYGYFFGVPFGYLGVFYYVSMFACVSLLAFGTSSRNLRLGALIYSAIGVGASICFMLIDLIFIQAFCIYCLISAILTLLLLISAISHFRAPAGFC